MSNLLPTWYPPDTDSTGLSEDSSGNLLCSLSDSLEFHRERYAETPSRHDQVFNPVELESPDTGSSSSDEDSRISMNTLGASRDSLELYQEMQGESYPDVSLESPDPLPTWFPFIYHLADTDSNGSSESELESLYDSLEMNRERMEKNWRPWKKPRHRNDSELATDEPNLIIESNHEENADTDQTSDSEPGWIRNKIPESCSNDEPNLECPSKSEVNAVPTDDQEIAEHNQLCLASPIVPDHSTSDEDADDEYSPEDSLDSDRQRKDWFTWRMSDLKNEWEKTRMEKMRMEIHSKFNLVSKTPQNRNFDHFLVFEVFEVFEVFYPF
eukprot:sb/3466737/